MFSDPAKWIVVGVILCVHLTHVACKKSTSPFDVKNVGGCFFWVFLLCFYCCGILLLVGIPPWAPLVPIACGLVLSGRQASRLGQVGVLLCGLAVGLGFLWSAIALCELPEYTENRILWQETDDQVIDDWLPTLDRTNTTKLYSPGYAGSMRFGQNTDRLAVPFHLMLPQLLWHTMLTGVYGRKVTACRVWLPGGTAEETLSGALAVPVGTPPGKEQEVGIPVQKFASDDY